MVSPASQRPYKLGISRRNVTTSACKLWGVENDAGSRSTWQASLLRLRCHLLRRETAYLSLRLNLMTLTARR